MSKGLDTGFRANKLWGSRCSGFRGLYGLTIVIGSTGFSCAVSKTQSF